MDTSRIVGGYATAPDMNVLRKLVDENQPHLATAPGANVISQLAKEALLVLDDRQEPKDKQDRTPPVVTWASAISSYPPSFSTSSIYHNSSANQSGISSQNEINGAGNNPGGNDNTDNNPPPPLGPGKRPGPNRRTGDRCERCIRARKKCDGVKPICDNCAKRKRGSPDCCWPQNRVSRSQLEGSDTARRSASPSGAFSLRSASPTASAPARPPSILPAIAPLSVSTQASGSAVTTGTASAASLPSPYRPESTYQPPPPLGPSLTEDHFQPTASAPPYQTYTLVAQDLVAAPALGPLSARETSASQPLTPVLATLAPSTVNMQGVEQNNTSGVQPNQSQGQEQRDVGVRLPHQNQPDNRIPALAHHNVVDRGRPPQPQPAEAETQPALHNAITPASVRSGGLPAAPSTVPNVDRGLDQFVSQQTTHLTVSPYDPRWNYRQVRVVVVGPGQFQRGWEYPYRPGRPTFPMTPEEAAPYEQQANGNRHPLGMMPMAGQAIHGPEGNPNSRPVPANTGSVQTQANTSNPAGTATCGKGQHGGGINNGEATGEALDDSWMEEYVDFDGNAN